MKYIITKGGEIIDTTKSIASASFFKPIKQADTVEELCDWLVFKLNGEIKALYKSWDIALQCEGNHIAIYKDIYGAIDTDEGLIYKAKMKGFLPNGEIDWELL